MKLNQVIALVSGQKTRSQSEVTEIYHKVQKPSLFAGVRRSYVKKFEDGDDLPSEVSNVQYTGNQAIADFRNATVNLFDLVLTQDSANCSAKADVVVNGAVIAANVPVTHLLFLEKKLDDLHTFVSKLPVLDTAKQWSFDAVSDCYVSNMTRTNKTKKVPKTHVLYEATKEHPAQTERYDVDEVVGHWDLIDYSGALPAKSKNEMLSRVRQLSDAVKVARELANSTEVKMEKLSDKLFDFVFKNAT